MNIPILREKGVLRANGTRVRSCCWLLPLLVMLTQFANSAEGSQSEDLANQRYLDGYDSYMTGDYSTAAQYLEQSYQRAPHSMTACLLSYVYYELLSPQQALHYASQALQQGPPLPEGQAQSAQGVIKWAREAISLLEQNPGMTLEMLAKSDFPLPSGPYLAVPERPESLVSPPANQYDYLRHKYSGKYVCTGSRDNGGRVHIWGPIPSGHEDRYRFRLESTNEEGYYYLKHKYSGKYVCTGHTANGGPIHLWGPIPAGHEDRYKFRLESPGVMGKADSPERVYYLKHKYSGKYVCTGHTANGGPIHIWGPIPSGHEERYMFEFQTAQ